jgi:hypothetical protein
VDHAVGRLRAGAQAVEVVELAAVDRRARSPECVGRGVLAGKADDVVARVEELLDDCGSDEAGSAGDEDAHGEPPVFAAAEAALACSAA